MNVELNNLNPNGQDGPAYVQAADQGDGRSRGTEVTEREALLPVQITHSNGETTTSEDVVEAQRIVGNPHTQIETSNLRRIKKEMNHVVFRRVRLWMVVSAVALLIVAVIVLSLIICAVINVDEDEKFDRSLFTLPQQFRGSFQLPNLVSTEEQPLRAKLTEKMNSLFGASPALGRYFSKAEILSIRNGSVTADYRLEFLLPEDGQDELRRFTLSRGTVLNVFRQFLYDQDPDEPMYIDPVSLSMG